MRHVPRTKKDSEERAMTTVKKGTKKSTATKLVDLTEEEVRALPKPREGFEAHVESLLATHAKFAKELASANVDGAKVRANLAAVAKLDESIAAARKHLEMLEETRLLLASNAWSDVLAIYGVAQVVAKRDAKVAQAIEPFVKFMSVGPRKKSEKKG
jgi:predicted RNase H-like nuclease (RuvC/YqgF family)